MDKTAGIEFLKDRLIAVEIERKQLEAEVQAINLLLAKHAGAKPKAPIASHVTRPTAKAKGGPSISSLIQKALMEAGKPQTTAQLQSFLVTHGRIIKNSSLRSTIHQSRWIESMEPGIYGLVEWVK